MPNKLSYTEARELLLRHVAPVEAQEIPLASLAGRILAQDVVARENVPPFDRSPYDGYAFQSADTSSCTAENPATLEILEEIPAGGVSHRAVTSGHAVKILTGAPIPEGADAVIPFEKTTFTGETVTLYAPCKAGSNIVRAGEDVRVGTLLAKAGTMVDAGLMGSLASQNIGSAAVYRPLRIGILATGSELLEVGTQRLPGKIYDSNRYMLCAAVARMGWEPVLLGQVADQTEVICAKIQEGLEECDALLITGGVSVGDYDLTPAAMEQAGVEILFRGVDMKPGMACAYGVRDGKPVCGLSGNPASSMTNFYAVALPVLKRLAGYAQCVPQEISLRLSDGFHKKSPTTRFLRGALEISDGTVRMRIPASQGNVVLSSAIGCDVMAVIPAGSGPIPPETEVKGFLI